MGDHSNRDGSVGRHANPAESPEDDEDPEVAMSGMRRIAAHLNRQEVIESERQGLIKIIQMPGMIKSDTTGQPRVTPTAYVNNRKPIQGQRLTMRNVDGPNPYYEYVQENGTGNGDAAPVRMIRKYPEIERSPASTSQPPNRLNSGRMVRQISTSQTGGQTRLVARTIAPNEARANNANNAQKNTSPLHARMLAAQRNEIELKRRNQQKESALAMARKGLVVFRGDTTPARQATSSVPYIARLVPSSSQAAGTSPSRSQVPALPRIGNPPSNSSMPMSSAQHVARKPVLIATRRTIPIEAAIPRNVIPTTPIAPSSLSPSTRTSTYAVQVVKTPPIAPLSSESTLIATEPIVAAPLVSTKPEKPDDNKKIDVQKSIATSITNSTKPVQTSNVVQANRKVVVPESEPLRRYPILNTGEVAMELDKTNEQLARDLFWRRIFGIDYKRNGDSNTENNESPPKPKKLRCVMSSGLKLHVYCPEDNE